MSSGYNPLATLAWPGQSGVNLPGGAPVQSSNPLATNGGAGGIAPSNWDSPNDLAKALGAGNLQTTNMKNQLLPAFSSGFFGSLGPMSQYASQLMNLGSPYYQQQQAATFGQGVQQGNNAAGQAKQQLAANGYGYAPSGLGAGMMGGMGQSSAANLSNLYQQNLFNNQQMQMQGAEMLGNIAQLLSPIQMTGQYTPIGNMQQTPTLSQAFANVMQGIGSMLSGGGQGAGSAMKALGMG